MKKVKVFAVILAAVMLVSAIPFGVSAEEEKVYTFAPTRDNGKVYGFVPGSTVGDVFDLFCNAVVEVHDSYGNVLTNRSDVIGTGCKIKVNGAAYTLVVMGDVNGDGKMNTVDYALVKRAYIGTATLSEFGLLAAGVPEGGKLRAINYVYIKRACVRTFDINYKYTCEPYYADSEPGWTEGWI